MLAITVPDVEAFNDNTQEFITLPGGKLQLEHSLISMSKWEAKWKTSFISSEELTAEQLVDYIKCMTINKVADETIFNRLTQQNVLDIRAYIDDKMTATTITNHDTRQTPRRRIITTEQIYGWMVNFGIPFDPCEKWHLNRLMMLIEVCGAQQSGGKKMTQKEKGAWMRAQHEKRKGRHK